MEELAASCLSSYRLPEEGDPPEVSSGLLVTPLEQAIENRDVEAVARILESGASFDPDWRNSAKQTVLHLMACAGRAALCRLLLTLGARVSLADRDGNTPLHLSCHFGHVSLFVFCFLFLVLNFVFWGWANSGTRRCCCARAEQRWER